MKYNVVVHYAGAWDFEVEADNQEQAEEIALSEFDKISPTELVAQLAECDVCDCWEINEEEQI